MRNANIIAAILRKRANAGGGGGDSDADAIIAALDSAGATPSAGEETAIQTFVTAMKSAGVWTKTHRLYFPIHGVAAANALDWKNLGSGTFSGSWTHASGYAVGAASSYFVGASDLSFCSTTNGAISFYCESSDTDSAKHDAGHFNNTDLYYDGATSILFKWANATGRVTGTISSGDKNGLVVGSSPSGGAGASFIRRRKTAGVASLGTGTVSGSALQGKPFLFGAVNFALPPGTTAVYHTLRQYRQWGIHDGFSTTEADNFSSACYTLLASGYGLTLV